MSSYLAGDQGLHDLFVDVIILGEQTALAEKLYPLIDTMGITIEEGHVAAGELGELALSGPTHRRWVGPSRR